ncbi:hypothetical protein D3C71_1120340 [compost metagenome]
MKRMEKEKELSKPSLSVRLLRQLLRLLLSIQIIGSWPQAYLRERYNGISRQTPLMYNVNDNHYHLNCTYHSGLVNRCQYQI